MTPSPVPSLILIGAKSSGHQVLSRGAQRSRRDAVGALDGFWWLRTIPEPGSGNPPPLLFKHPARGFALESTPRTGLDSPAMTRRPHREH
jgi:hypothetical protein